MRDVEPLIESILKVRNITEEGLCKALEYNEGYISQIRSREKTTGEPQVSTKFYNQLKSLQNASIGTENGQLRTPNEQLADQIEARRRDFEKWAELARQDKEKAEQEKDRLLNIIENNLTLLIQVVKSVDANSKEIAGDISLLTKEVQAEHRAIMDTVDKAARQTIGTTRAAAGKLELASHQNKQKKDKKAGAHK